MLVALCAIFGAAVALSLHLLWQPHAARRRAFAAAARSVRSPPRTPVVPAAVGRVGVVMVGGDLARSPRMQYHAVSMARSGLFDEVRLVGLDHGNRLCEDLRSLVDAAAAPGACSVTLAGTLLLPPQVPAALAKNWLLRTPRRTRRCGRCRPARRALARDEAAALADARQAFLLRRALAWEASTPLRFA